MMLDSASTFKMGRPRTSTGKTGKGTTSVVPLGTANGAALAAEVRGASTEGTGLRV
jgi:hypothetical protein